MIRPHAAGWHRGYDSRAPVWVEINSHGFRGPEPFDHPEVRVAFIGDSITFDCGVPWENTFIALIEHNWRVQHGKTQWECLNFGLSDSGLDQYGLKLKHHVLPHTPDAVVVDFYLNDSRPPQGFLGETGKAVWERKLMRSGFYNLLSVRKLHRKYRVAKYSRRRDLLNRFRWTKRFYDKTYLNDEASWHALLAEADYDWGAAWLPATWDSVAEKMTQIKGMCSTNGIELFCVCFPASPQVEVGNRYANIRYPQERMADLCALIEVPYLDLLPAFLQSTNTHLFSDQCHLTSAGNQLVAETLGPWLLEKLKGKVRQ